MSLPANVLRHIYALANKKTQAKMHVLNRSTLANKAMPAQYSGNYTRGAGKLQKKYNELEKKCKILESVIHKTPALDQAINGGMLAPMVLRTYFAYAKELYRINAKNPNKSLVRASANRSNGPVPKFRVRMNTVGVPANRLAFRRGRMVHDKMGKLHKEFVVYANSKIGRSGYFEIMTKTLLVPDSHNETGAVIPRQLKAVPRGRATDAEFMDVMTEFCWNKYKQLESKVGNPGLKSSSIRANAKQRRQGYWSSNELGNKAYSAKQRVARRQQRRAAAA